VERRRSRWGPNLLATAGRPSLLSLFLNQFKDFMVLVLLGATLISGLLGEFSDALTILIIVILNAVLGVIQEYRAERSLEALKKMAAPRATVLREGRIATIPAEEVVPGEIVLVEAGDRVCADLRLLSAQSLAVNEAPLTGESVAVEKMAAPLPGGVENPGDALNMLFSGTIVVSGRGRGVAVATGMETQMGQIAHLIAGAEQTATPLQQRLSRLGAVLVGACLAVCALVAGLGIYRGLPPYQMFMAGVTLAVAAIPEGLPAIVTISLALGVQRMARRRAIVRRLPAVETLGSASVICSDKTGTLTENRMVLRQIQAGGRVYRREGEAFQVQGSRGWSAVSPARDRTLQLALLIGACCNNASSQGKGYRGDPTEVALLEAAERAGLRIKREKRERELAFTPERKMMSVIWRDGSRRLMLKGAPEIVLERCRYVWSGDRAVLLDREGRRELAGQIEKMAALSWRSLAVAMRELPPRRGREGEAPEELERDLVWVGLMGLEDPPRPEVLPAIRLCRQAGIRVIMITGDHRSTAVAIARRLEIVNRRGRVLTGAELAAMDDRELARAVRETQVFARVNPGDKLRIVRAFKKQGCVVAMTGDGVNDAPAVKEADIGIAMGRTGTDVTREAAALVLADDNFSTIVAAVEEGRNIYNNIRKFIRFLLGCNIGEILTMVAAVGLGLPLPLRPIQILWINLVTDGLPALALGNDPPQEELMQEPPRERREGVFSRGLWRKLLTRGVLIGAVTILVFYRALLAGMELARAQSMALATLILAQLVYVFDCRSEEKPLWLAKRRPNWLLNAAVASSLLLMVLVVQNPTLARIFCTVPLSWGEWAAVAGAGLVPSLLDGIGYLLKRAIKS